MNSGTPVKPLRSTLPSLFGCLSAAHSVDCSLGKTRNKQNAEGTLTRNQVRLCLPTPFCHTALMVIAFVLYQFTAKGSLSNLLSKLRGFLCHFTSFPFRKNGAGFSRVLSHKTHAAQPFFSIRKANGVVSARNISGKAVRTPRGELSWPRKNCFLSFTE